MSEINNIFLKQTSLNKADNNGKQNEEPALFNPSLNSKREPDSSSLNAPKFGYLLAELPEQYVTPEILKIREKTKSSFAKQKYRSTIDNAKLVKLFTAEKEALENTNINIDGKDFELNKDRILPLSKDQLKKGFKVKHSSDLQLSLNAELVGPRKNRIPADNGYNVQKWWFDAEGKHVDDQLITAQQGQLFTVVIQINKTSTNRDGDVLITDLLPAGFEIEDALVAPPSLSSVGVYHESDVSQIIRQIWMTDLWLTLLIDYI